MHPGDFRVTMFWRGNGSMTYGRLAADLAAEQIRARTTGVGHVGAFPSRWSSFLARVRGVGTKIGDPGCPF